MDGRVLVREIKLCKWDECIEAGAGELRYSTEVKNEREGI